MEDRFIRLLTFEVQGAFYVRRDAEQVQAEWILNHMLRFMGDELASSGLLPLKIVDPFEYQRFDDSTSVLLQVLDASITVIKGSKPAACHPDRHLVRLEAVAWSSEHRPDELTTTMNLRLEGGRRRLLYLMLQKPFEITMASGKPWTYLCMAMTRSTFAGLFVESQDLDRRLDLALTNGFKVEMGQTQEQVAKNSRSLDRAYERAAWIFDEMDQADVLLSPVLSREDLKPFMKIEDYPFPPALRHWREEIETTPLSDYLKAA